MGEIDDIFLGHLFLIMCPTNIKNFGDIYYPKNWDNFHNKINYILVENEPTKLILILTQLSSTNTSFYVGVLTQLRQEKLILFHKNPSHKLKSITLTHLAKPPNSLSIAILTASRSPFPISAISTRDLSRNLSISSGHGLLLLAGQGDLNGVFNHASTISIAVSAEV